METRIAELESRLAAAEIILTKLMAQLHEIEIKRLYTIN